jgi:uncharacterized protein with PIN domain
MKELKPKFLLDENLNRLARWLRMLGYDAAVYESVSIHNKVRLAKKERRIYLTRSKKTAKLKEEFSRFLIRADDHQHQLGELRQFLKFNDDFIFTRCINCNRKLEKISKEKIKEIILPNIYKTFNEFNICRKCGKVYWKGSHYASMKRQLKNMLTI